MRNKKLVFFCALGLLLVALLSTFDVSATIASSRPGPFFIFPEGTDWYILERYGGPYYHTGCEDGSCVAGPIKGYDYIAPRGTEILAPFSGTTTATCYHDGVGNTVFALKSDDGKYEFGALHLRCKVSGVQHVDAGEVIGWVDSIGRSYEPHCHCWFRDLVSGENIKDHDQFWDGIGDTPSPPNPPEPPSPPNPDDPEWLKKLKELRDKLSAWVKILDVIINWFDDHPEITRITKYLEDGFEVLFNLIRGKEEVIPTPVPTPIPIPEPTRFEFSISDQKPGDTDYQHNIRAFFAWPTSGEDLQKMNQMDLTNFEGSWTINPGKQSVNAFFGSEKYEKEQGMVVPSTGGIGDGSCNAASMVSYVSAMGGLDVERDNPTHAPVPGVPQQYVATVCIPSENYKCTEMDVRVTNPFDYPVILHWKIDGDTLTMWIETRSDVPPNPTPPSIPSWLYCLGGLLMFGIVILLIVWLLPHKSSEALVWIKDHGPYWWRIGKSAFFESLRWWLVELALIWLFWPQIRELSSQALWIWLAGITLMANWKIAALATAIVINLFLRVRVYVRVTRDQKGHYVVKKKLRGCLGNLGIVVSALVLFVLVAAYLAGKVSGETPDPPTPPVPGECSLSSEVPERTRRWCDLIDQNADKFSIDSAFIAAVMDVESKGDPDAMSECDAVGLMQVMPSDLTPKTIACGALSCGGPCFKGRPTIEELLDPETNVFWGSQILASHYRRYGSYAEAAHYYNWNGGQAYVDMVMAKYLQWR